MVTIEDEGQQTADMIRHRAMGALDRADATLAAERPWAEGAAAFEQLAREAREPEPVAGTARTAPRPSPAFDGAAFGDKIVGVVREHIDRKTAPIVDRLAALESRRSDFDGEAFGDAVVAAVKNYVARANAPLLDRIAALESRLAAAEGRLAGVESKGARRK